MSQRETQYDVIVIGTGESGREAVEALKKEGKIALFLEMKPETVTTMVYQNPRQSVHEGHPSSDVSDPIFIGDEQSHITLNQHTLYTANTETTTLTFHVEELLEFEQTEQTEQEPTTMIYSDDQLNQSHHLDLVDESSVNESNNELVAEEVIEKHINPHVFLEERENSLREKMIRRSTLQPFSEEPHDLEQPSFYQFDNDLSSNEPNQLAKDHWQDTQTTYIIDQEESSHKAPVYEQPVYREREIRLRKRLVGGHRPSLLGTPEQNHLGYTDPSLLSANQPQSLTPFSNVGSSFDSESSESPSSPYTYSESGIHPFSSRKRSRSQKKSLLLQSQPLYKEESQSSIHPPSYPPALWEGPGFIGGNVNPNQPYDDFFFRNGPELQPFQSKQQQEMPFQPVHQEPFQSMQQQEMKQSPHIQQEAPFQSLQYETQPFSSEQYKEDSGETSSDSLKRDTIEFEDAYGGYESWEEFLTPFSQNNRKRQEMDEIEKRKIALRGLHSLINNLG